MAHFKGRPFQSYTAFRGHLRGTWRTTYRVSILVTFVSFCLAKCPACEHSAHCQLSQPVKSSESFLSPLSRPSCCTSRPRSTMKAPARLRHTVSAREGVAFNDGLPLTLFAVTANCILHSHFVLRYIRVTCWTATWTVTFILKFTF